jgi:hypothetical protein
MLVIYIFKKSKIVKFVILADLLRRFPITTFSKKFKKKFCKFFVKGFFDIFLANSRPQPIWGQPAKIWVFLGPLVWEEIDTEQTVHTTGGL